MYDDIMHVVVQKATDPDQILIGRPPSFSTEKVVANALDTFWRLGYEETSLADLERDTGVNRSTIYNSFDGKEGLFVAAVASYLDEVEATMVGPLRDGTGGLSDLLAFIERRRAPVTDPAVPRGCLLANAMVTGDAASATSHYVRTFRDAIDAALDRAVELGEIGPEEQSPHAATFLACTLGVNLAAKSGMSVTELHELLDGLRDTVKGWAIDPG